VGGTSRLHSNSLFLRLVPSQLLSVLQVAIKKQARAKINGGLYDFFRCADECATVAFGVSSGKGSSTLGSP